MIALVLKPRFSYFIEEEVGASSPEVSSTGLEQTWVCLIPLDLGSTGLVPHPMYQYIVQAPGNDCSNPGFSSTKGAGRGQGCTPPQARESSKKGHQLSLPTPPARDGGAPPCTGFCFLALLWSSLSQLHGTPSGLGSLTGGGGKLGNERGLAAHVGQGVTSHGNTG